MRRCPRCGATKPERAFAVVANDREFARPRRHKHCRRCRATARARRHRLAALVRRGIDPATVRRCRRCKHTRPLQDFEVLATGNRRRLCSECAVSYGASSASEASRRYRERRGLVAVPPKQIEGPGGEVLRICSACGYWKPASPEYFGRHGRTRSGGPKLTGACRGCIFGCRATSLPVAPLAAAIIARANGGGLTRAAERATVDPRLLLSWRKGEIRRAQAATADRVLLALGAQWWEVFDAERFPDEYAQALRVFGPVV